jgi:Amt family ammonium transporter
VCGILGTLCVGLFAEARFSADVGNGLFFGGSSTLFVNQLIGVVAVGAYVCVASFLIWKALALTLGIRVTQDEELLGLDLSEMGLEAYALDSVPHHLPSRSLSGIPARVSPDPVLAREK